MDETQIPKKKRTSEQMRAARSQALDMLRKNPKVTSKELVKVTRLWAKEVALLRKTAGIPSPHYYKRSPAEGQSLGRRTLTELEAAEVHVRRMLEENPLVSSQLLFAETRLAKGKIASVRRELGFGFSKQPDESESEPTDKGKTKATDAIVFIPESLTRESLLKDILVYMRQNGIQRIDIRVDGAVEIQESFTLDLAGG